MKAIRRQCVLNSSVISVNQSVMSLVEAEASGDYTPSRGFRRRDVPLFSPALAALFYFPPERAHLNRRPPSADVYISMHYSATSRHNKERPSSSQPPSRGGDKKTNKKNPSPDNIYNSSAGAFSALSRSSNPLL